jgi:hypothetical protein
MNTFTKKSLYAALAGLGALGAAGSANAVHVNPNGLGQVLLYPYYTVRSITVSAPSIAPTAAPYNSLLSVVNSTSSGKAVKVRFLEGKMSQEVLDFNLFLSPKDVWTTAIIPTATGTGIFTADKSCTVPAVSKDVNNPTPFVNFLYASDPAGGSLDRTREGYVEIIEMGNVTGATLVGITHVAGVPTCAATSDAIARTNTVLGNGGLFGGISLVNVLSGTLVSADAVALESFNTAGPIFGDSGTVFPDLNSGTTSFEIYNNNAIVSGTTTNGYEAVSAALFHKNVYNEYVLDTLTKSGTDWVVTFPTKRYFYNFAAATSTVIPLKAAQITFQRNFTVNGACDDIAINIFDREEQFPSTPGGFSPPPPGAPAAALCWESNVITFNNSGVLGSTNSNNVSTTYQNGWMDLDITNVSATVHKLSTSAGLLTGLPVIGFGVQNFLNGTLVVGTGSVQSNYGGNFIHKYTSPF